MTESVGSSGDGGIVEVEFAVTSPEYPFVAIASAEECRLHLEKVLPRGGGRFAEYFSVVGADPEHVVRRVNGARASGVDGGGYDCEAARVLVDADHRSLVEVVVGEDCPARFLAERGAIPTTVEGTPDGGTIVAEVLSEDDPGRIVEAFVSEHDVELVAKRVKPTPTPLLGENELQAAILDRLTERQREVLRTAQEEGYYERPRRKSGEEVAAEMGISPTTFQEHVRAAERKLVTFLVEEDP